MKAQVAVFLLGGITLPERLILNRAIYLRKSAHSVLLCCGPLSRQSPRLDGLAAKRRMLNLRYSPFSRQLHRLPGENVKSFVVW